MGGIRSSDLTRNRAFSPAPSLADVQASTMAHLLPRHKFLHLSRRFFSFARVGDSAANPLMIQPRLHGCQAPQFATQWR